MCGPHGLKFKKPIELRLPHKGNSSEGMSFSLKSSDSPVGKHVSFLLLVKMYIFVEGCYNVLSYVGREKLIPMHVMPQCFLLLCFSLIP